MRRPEDFKILAVLLLLPLAASPQQSGIVREGDRYVRDFNGLLHRFVWNDDRRNLFRVTDK